MIMAIAIVLAGILGFITGESNRKKKAEATIGSAEQEAKRILADAITKAENKKQEILLEGKDEILKQKNESEKVLNDRRRELQKQEKRITQKEDSLDKKMDGVEKKREELAVKEQEIEKNIQEAEEIKQSQLEVLEKISEFSKQQAREFILDSVEKDLTHEKAVKILEFEKKFKDEANIKAKEMISLAMQRCASDFVTEATVSVVPLINDDMKGRIIGREGRNIRAIENLTGVDLIIDDTPESITLSSFDPIRREIARLTLERLIQDGRIHPSKIEEMLNKARKDVEDTIKSEGERAMLKVGIPSMRQNMINYLGRLRYRTSYGQNVLNHSLEVAFLSGIIADEMGEDSTLAKRAGLLHDIGKSIDYEMEGSHVSIGVEIAKKNKENADVIHAIEAHHGDVEAKTAIACIVQTADALSAARPGARRENLENYVKRLEKLEEIASSFEGVDKSFAIQAGREVRIMVKPEKINDDEMVILAHDICQKIESELDYPGQIKVNIIRESRVSACAK